MYSLRYPTVLVYMLQNTEYHVGPYLRWFWQTSRFDKVMYRRALDRTKAARLLLLAVRLGIALQVALGVFLVILGINGTMTGGVAFGIAVIISYPAVWAHVVTVPLVLGRTLIVQPRQRAAVRASKARFAAFDGPKIAVAGSYGKTSMKELLLTVLSEGKIVAATPANKNVAISHAEFINRLKGDEEILIIEYGEGEPGDVVRFAEVTQPSHAIITGIAPAHLDKYKTVQAAGRDIFAVSKAVPANNVYVNAESPDALPFVEPGQQLYDQKHVLGWRVSGIRINLDGTRFTMQKGKDKLELHSGLLGRHQVGPLALVAALAHEFGLNKAQIEAGIANTHPFEHRMEPYQIGGAWIVDDTYNGNIEGIRAGAQLLRELPGKRKIYVTPGLVDQGKETKAVHEAMGRAIAGAQPDMVVLMKHSVTRHIQAGLEEGGFKGELLIETDPLNFYTNLQLFVANGDLVLMQNDWPDNYL